MRCLLTVAAKVVFLLLIASGVTCAVQSDYEADLELIDHGYAANESDAAHKALWAGVDMSMQSGLYRKFLPTLAEEGKLSMSTLDEAVRRVLDSKARMGASCNPYRHGCIALRPDTCFNSMLWPVGGLIYCCW